LTDLEMALAWGNAEILQGKVMVALGIVFALSTIAVLWIYTDLIRGFSLPAILIFLALCGYGASMIISRPAQMEQFTVQYQESPSAFRSAEQHRTVDLSRSLSRNKLIWIAILIAACFALWLLPTTTWRSLAAGFMLASTCALIIDTALEHRATAYHRQLVAMTR
jgi:hypothetical protein